MPRRADPDPELPRLVSRSDAECAGLTAGQIQHRLRTGAWRRVGRGMYLREPEADAGLDECAAARVEHVRRAAAALRRNVGCVIGWHSAALVHGLPLVNRPESDVCLLVPAGHWTGRRNGVAFRYSSDRRGIDVVGGVTSPARTWVDIARNGSLADALSAGDAALRRGVTRLEEVRLLLDGLPAGRGSRRAPRALRELDPARETPLESASWAYFMDWAVPLPVPQVEFHDADGHFVARVDFAWEGRRVIGECDGRLKYVAPDSLYKEKRREDALRAMGLTVVRWGAADLRSGALAARLRGLLQ